MKTLTFLSKISVLFPLHRLDFLYLSLEGQVDEEGSLDVSGESVVSVSFMEIFWNWERETRSSAKSPHQTVVLDTTRESVKGFRRVRTRVIRRFMPFT